MRFLTMFGFALALAVGAHAQDLYNNLDPLTVGTNPAFAIGNDTEPCAVGAPSCMPLYNSFMSGSASEVLTGVTLALGPTPLTADPVQVTLYEDLGGFQTYNDFDPINLQPGFAVSLGQIQDTDVAAGGPNFYSLSGLSVTLAANTRYWIGLSGISTVEWIYGDLDESTATGVAGQYSDYGDANSAGGSQVVSNSDFMPFEMQVTAAAAGVPEPSTFLPLIGLAGLAISRLRRRR